MTEIIVVGIFIYIILRLLRKQKQEEEEKKLTKKMDNLYEVDPEYAATYKEGFNANSNISSSKGSSFWSTMPLLIKILFVIFLIVICCYILLGTGLLVAIFA
ncbi:MAG: hypothetical protein SOY60_05210 [Fusobacterium gastrosuis]|uniref:hypothetical protein n=1 Tax=Fusobacterium gastrosuis TaxID=1755100 RepID=UPI00297A213F|nr:hypothetical protein [Fusobacteriaceae bacterium]MDY4011045.1 hypothetical protein [Fusobacterium gastrosuis]MDY5714123.1 hypothetical protein [Fusobacterium gastrosuis]